MYETSVGDVCENREKSGEALSERQVGALGDFGTNKCKQRTKKASFQIELRDKSRDQILNTRLKVGPWRRDRI